MNKKNDDIQFGDPETWHQKVNEFIDDQKPKTKKEILDAANARGHFLPGEFDYSNIKIGYNDEVTKMLFEDNTARRCKDGKLRDATDREYTVEEAVKNNIEIFQRRKSLNLGNFNPNNNDPELLDYQRKFHYKLFRKNK